MASDRAAERVLIVAPVGRDAAAIAELLERHGFLTQICAGAAEAAVHTAAEAGALVLTEESLEREHVPALLGQLRAQPAWSELPVIVLTNGGEPRFARLLDLAADAAGSITLLERPLGKATLLRAVEVALHSRRRQYLVRDLLVAQSAREAALREADHRKDTFLAVLSHELRNPLAPIRNAVELLDATNLTPAQLRWTQSVIRRQTAHMADLLDDLLDLARITQGKLRLRREPCSLDGVVEAAVETARPLLDQRKHELRILLPEDAPTFQADPLRLAEAISNLLMNAAKYTDVGGSIELSVQVNDGLVISVRDNGIGIAEEQLGCVFRMFSQVSAGNRSEGGLGIGLALVKGFVELHGGSVEAHSAGPGRGSEFIIRLPFVPVSAEPAPAESVGTPAPAARKLRMLIADDNRDAADSLALLLSHHGYEVRTAYGGQGAVSVAQDFRPDVALLDIGMPAMDGYAAASAIRQLPGGKDIRLIALTGWGQDEDKRRSSEAGFAAHLTKPLEFSQLQAILGQQRRGEDGSAALRRAQSAPSA